MELLIKTGAIETVREVWWDIRPHPDFGTVEAAYLRWAADAGQVTAVAAMAQCLVRQMDGQLDRGFQLPEPRAWVVRENKWQAAR
jgi:carboxylate-amine ligase